MSTTGKSPDPKVTVAVSPEMAELRATQTLLNQFLWTTELSYGYVLSKSATEFPDPAQPASEVLGHVATAAWYPNNQGRIKYGDSVEKFLEQVNSNTIHICRAVFVYFTSALEDYLKKRVGSLKVRTQEGGWGPYLESLSSPALRQSKTPLHLKTVLCADLCRSIRNRVVHPPFEIPQSIQESGVISWRAAVRRKVMKSAWADPSAPAIVDSAFSEVVGNAAAKVKQARSEMKTHPIELFYALFAFTNFDSLAFEIEEALIPTDARPGAEVARKRGFVRRTDLITGEIAEQVAAADGGRDPGFSEFNGSVRGRRC